MADDRRMSDVEALMWTIEKDPALTSSFANVTILDRPPDVERLRRRLEEATAAVPRLHQRVAPALGRLAPPEWQDDPDFDIGYHVRHLALPAPGTERQLFDLASLLAQAPFDRTRPLWEFTIVDGVDGGRAALFQKLHHTITDGEGGVRMSVQFLDLDREGSGAARAPAHPAEPAAPEPPGPANLFGTAFETVAHNLRRQLGIARRAAEEAAGFVTHPERLAGASTEIVETVRSLARQVAVTDRARSPLWTTRSLRRRFEVLQVPLDDAKRAAKTLGGSVNDVFVTGAAGAAGAYHRAKGADVDELRISMPVSTRSRGEVGGNAFAPSRVLVPVGIEDPVARFAAVRDRLAVTKRERALGLASALAGVMNVLPTSVLVRFARQQVETVDFATSNVRGAPFDLYVAGARIEANYPMGPLAGTAFNITLLSYRGSLDMGLNIDAAAIDDPELLRTCMEEAFADLLEAG